MRFVERVVAFIFTLVLYTGAVYGRETLHLGALISQQAGASFDYSGFLPTLALALETIDNDSSLRYRFEVTINNSMVLSITIALLFSFGKMHVHSRSVKRSPAYELS